MQHAYINTKTKQKKLDPKSGEALNLLGLALEALDQPKRALVVFQQAAEVYMNQGLVGHADIVLTNVARVVEEPSLGRQILEMALQRSANVMDMAKVRRAQGQNLLELELWQEAEEIFSQADSGNPFDDNQAALGRCRALLRLRRLPEAASLAELVVDRAIECLVSKVMVEHETGFIEQIVASDEYDHRAAVNGLYQISRLWASKDNSLVIKCAKILGMSKAAICAMWPWCIEAWLDFSDVNGLAAVNALCLSQKGEMVHRNMERALHVVIDQAVDFGVTSDAGYWSTRQWEKARMFFPWAFF